MSLQWLRDHSHRSGPLIALGVSVLGLVVGCLYTASILGLDAIDPTNISWLKNDPAATYLGWAFYRRQEGLTWPLTYTQHLGYPLGVSASYFGVIPLVAVTLKPFESLLPQPFQYFGLWSCLTFSLQFVAGWTLCRVLRAGSATHCLLGAALLLLAPVLTLRLFGHFALMAHWLILLALTLYFHPTISPRRRIGLFAALLALAGAISPYIALMCSSIAAAAALKGVLEGRSWRRELVGLGLIAVSCVVALSVFGFVLTADMQQYTKPGYGVFSMNLLAPVNPIQFSSLLKPLPMADHRQREGFNYLGLGVLALLIVGVAVAPWRLSSLRSARIFPLLLLSLVLTLLAASHEVTLGSATLFTIPLPEPMLKILSAFRSSGRLFWPVHYLLTVAAVALISRIPHARRAFLILAFGVALQFVDLAQLRTHCKARHQRRAESPLKSPVWRQLGETHRNLVVLPAWPCFRNVERPRYHFFGMLADSEQMNLNSYEAARYSAREREFHCRELPEQVQRGYWDPETAYVFTPDFYSFVWRAPTSHKCEEIDGFVLCYSESDVTSSVQPRAPLFPAEDRLEFSSGAPWSAGYLGLGWYPLRRFGVWSHGRATVHFRLSQEQAARYSKLRLRLFSLVPPGGLHYRLLLNGRTVRSGTVADDRARTRKVFEEKIPLDISLDKNIALTLETDRPTNRRDLGISSDSPNRGLGLMWAKLEP